MQRHETLGTTWLTTRVVIASLLALALVYGDEGQSCGFENDETTARQDEPLQPGDRVKPFALDTFSGRPFHWGDDKPTTPKCSVIVFTGTECPLAKLYVPRLKSIQATYQAHGVSVILVDSNSQDSLLEMESYARRMELELPFLKDPGSELAKAFGATRTPEAFVIDGDLTLRYAGRIDDQYGVGVSRPKPTRTEVVTAIEAVLQGDVIDVTRTESVGCLIGQPPTSSGDTTVTYANQIARLFQKHCIECHREGNIGPFSMESYDDVAGWADMINEVVQTGRMPPWNADESVGQFRNARRISSEERNLLATWVRNGAPQGDPSVLPEPDSYVEDWQLPRQPDAVIQMSQEPFRVPAEGVVEYKYFVVDPGFTEDKWVESAEVVPGDSSVVHHAIVFFRAPDSDVADHLGWIGAYVPGQRVPELETGLARRVPKGSRLVFQMHYTPNGTPTDDITRVGLCFVDEESVRREVITIPSIERDFEIPPGAKDHIVESSIRGFPEGSTMLGVAPHMHVRGKSFELSLDRGDAISQQAILRVPRYDFNWQHSYWLADPIDLRPSDEFRSICHFDNSDENLANPDPEAYVTWGDQTFEEMAVTFFELALPPGLTAEEVYLQRNRERIDHQQESLRSAKRLMDRFDKDQDGKIRRQEVPESFAAFAFQRYDEDRDNAISEGELLKRILRDRLQE